MNDVITVVGNVASDPAPQTIAGGRTVTSFRLACTERRFDDQSKQWIDHNTNWYTVKAWETLGVNAAASLRKGERVIVTGKLRVRRWESEERSGTEVEITADGLGHDLRWGTAAFTRTHRGARADSRVGQDESSESDASGPALQEAASARADVGVDAWATPVLEGEPTPF